MASLERNELNASRRDVLITGDTGFLGQALVRNLGDVDHWVLRRDSARGAPSTARCLVWNQNSPEESLADAFNEARPEVTVHLAWRDIRDHSVANLEYNVDLAMQVTAAALSGGCARVIHIGTAWECAGLVGRVSESDVGLNLPAFANAKRELRDRARELCAGSSTEVVWARVFYAYGPGQRRESLLGSIATELARPNPELLKFDSQVAHDFVYSEDVAAGFRLLMMHSNAHGDFDIGSGQLASLRQIARISYGFAGIDYPTSPPHSADDWTFVAPSLRLRGLGWSPAHSLQVGIEQTMASMTVPNAARTQ